MAAPKATKKKRAAGDDARDAGDGALRLFTDSRYERRFEARTPVLAALTVLGMSIGAVLVGAGTYGQWLRAEQLGPHPWAPYLLAGGAVALLIVAVFGQRLPKPIRVGDAGIAVEKEPSDLDRIGWFEVQRIYVDTDLMTIQASGRALSIPLTTHAAAAARAMAEAKKRIPTKIEDGAAAKIGAPDDAAGETLPLDPPQVTGLRCRKTEKAIGFEKDARFCGACGEVYDKESVPKRCLTCDAKLR